MGGSADQSVANSALYHAFGLTIASDYPLSYARLESGGRPDLVFHLTRQPPTDQTSRNASLIFSSASEIGYGKSAVQVHRTPEYDLVSFTDVADYYLWPDRIVCHLHDREYEYAVELYLFGVVFAIWMERRGMLTLHGSAVAVGDWAIAILGGKHGGKTTLAAALLLRGGSLLTDDIVVIEPAGDQFLVRPTYPEMRLWPDQAQHFFGMAGACNRLHPKSPKLRVSLDECPEAEFCDTGRPLVGIYLPEDGDTDRTTITAVTGARAVVTLVGNSYAAHIVEAMGLRAGRFDLVSRLAGEVPIRHVVYPRGLDHVPDVARAIIHDEVHRHPTAA